MINRFTRHDRVVCLPIWLRSGTVLQLEIGDYRVPFPGTGNSFNPKADSTFRFVIPDSMEDGARVTFSCVSNLWRVILVDYSGGYSDCSDSCFTVMPR